jgi:hypothetical protein
MVTRGGNVMSMFAIFLFLLPTLATAGTQTAEAKPLDISHTAAVHAALKLHEDYYTKDGKRKIEEPKPEAQKPPTPPQPANAAPTAPALQYRGNYIYEDECRIL